MIGRDLGVLRAHALGVGALRGLAIVATVAEGADSISQLDLRAPALVLIGNEGAGLPDDVVGRADLRGTVPMRPGVNSLNVAVAAAILLYEARRQRGIQN